MTILMLSVLINRSYFQLSVLKTGIYRFSRSATLLALSLSCATGNGAVVAMFS